MPRRRCAIGTQQLTACTRRSPVAQEFGNFIGEIEDSDDDGSQEDQQQQQQYASTSTRLAGYDDEEEEEDGVAGDGDIEMGDDDEDDQRISRAGNAIILHEDKKYYSTAQEIYGEDVETMVQEEDQQPLSEPIVAPIRSRKFRVEEKDLPETTYDKKCVRGGLPSRSLLRLLSRACQSCS